MNLYLEILLIAFGINTVFFFYAFIRKTDVVTDLSYSLSFFIAGLYLYAVHAQKAILQTLLLVLVVLWALRLGTYLLGRILATKVDHRFDDKRNSFVRFGIFWLLQATAVWVILLPVTFAMGQKDLVINYSFLIVGFVLSIFGLVYETIADHQKNSFKKKNPKKLITTGLWATSRHPNYFGEILVWWGTFIMVVPYLSGLSFLVLLGPLFITLLLLFVSGVNLLEKSWKEKYGKEAYYQEYVRQTSIFIPWKKKK
ncbi:DUF1295 domain-containing protein [Sphaerochaeta sp. PS]|uniref:DUF1295 domain-containing protein n=1 Tax=Sphaerochaeta sp. PS TaxID=3076336 RepID=UPI0028A3DF96|nr:DUF1295 domain-containing protein [Sphaerochaeta sp. PS]MDT4762024.1 DUF1295 domain-containing protein [Sphaerochaeta sp. PS]